MRLEKVGREIMSCVGIAVSSLIIGIIIGIFVMAICSMSSREDRRNEK